MYHRRAGKAEAKHSATPPQPFSLNACPWHFRNSSNSRRRRCPSLRRRHTTAKGLCHHIEQRKSREHKGREHKGKAFGGSITVKSTTHYPLHNILSRLPWTPTSVQPSLGQPAEASTMSTMQESHYTGLEVIAWHHGQGEDKDESFRNSSSVRPPAHCPLLNHLAEIPLTAYMRDSYCASSALITMTYPIHCSPRGLQATDDLTMPTTTTAETTSPVASPFTNRTPYDDVHDEDASATLSPDLRTPAYIKCRD